MKKLLSFFLLFLSLGLVSACGTTLAPSYDIYVTVYPLEYMIDQLMDGTGVTVGMVPGVTSHEESVDWSPKQIIAMTEADYLFYVGANFDVYIDNQIETIFQSKDVTLIKLETLAPSLMIPGIIDHHDHETEHLSEEEELGLDPHFWISPKRMLLLVDFFYEMMVDETNGYPQFSSHIANRREILRNQLISLDLEYEKVINSDSRMVMTSTNLYGYLTADYGLKVCSISPGYHEEADQFTTAQKELIVNEAMTNNIRHIIYERNASSPLSNAIFDALVTLGVDPVKLEFDVLHILREEENALGHNYFDIMMGTNLETFKTATGYSE